MVWVTKIVGSGIGVKSVKLFSEKDGVRIVTNKQTWALRKVPKEFQIWNEDLSEDINLLSSTDAPGRQLRDLYESIDQKNPKSINID